MSNGASMDYDFGSKRQLRRWLWNRIAERTEPSTAVVLYLAGELDFDRRHAVSKGFREENLIAVERDVKACAELRRTGALTIQGDFLRSVVAFAAREIVDCVYGDMCGGLSWDVVNSSKTLLFSPATWNCIFAFNLRRGQDPATSKLRALFLEDIDQAVLASLGYGDECQYRSLAAMHGVSPLHRGLFLMIEVYFELYVMFLANEFAMTEEEFLCGGLASLNSTQQAVCDRFGDELYNAMQPSFMSYRSAANRSNIYDAVIYSNPLPVLAARYKLNICGATFKDAYAAIANRNTTPKARRAVAAVRAVRTKRRRQ